MDEPTNDLDIESLELLEECLTNFTGTLLLISHDRAFLDNVVTSTWAFEGNGVVREYVGGYEDWLRQRTIASPSSSVSTANDPDKKTSSAPEITPASSRKKLSYKEQRELEALPAQIAALEAEQKNLSEKLSDASYFVKAPQEAAQSAERLTQIDEELLLLLERWETLEN